MRIRRFDPITGGEADLRGTYEVFAASELVDAPHETPMSFEHYAGRLKNPAPVLGPTDQWLAEHDGRVVALASVSFLDVDNEDIATIHVTVHPDHRGRGTGTALLRALLPSIRERGRTRIDAWGVERGGSGEAWARSLGFVRVHSTVRQALFLDGADGDPRLERPEPGYRLDRWVGAAPDRLVASYARARMAIHDAPTGDAAFRSPDWTVQRVRESEADLEQRRINRFTVVAVQEATGDVVGLTEVEFHPHRADRAYQEDTVVVPAHRGHRLGVAMKAHMLRWLRDQHAGLREISTSTGSGNTHMIRINHELGYTDLREQVVLEADVAELDARLT